MTWKHYTLVFRLQSPLRIGARETGNLLSTHPYVPGRVLWAALTARVTRNRQQGQRGGAYREIGNDLQDNIRFGYLWPSLDGQTPFYPWQDPAEFDYLFLNSYVSTALDYHKQSALEGSLHEAEYIAPYTRRGGAVCLTGSLWVKDGYAFDDCENALKHIQLGGERRYGWGRVSLDTFSPTTNNNIPDPEDFAWGTDKFPAHVHALGVHAPHINGRVEPLIGWEMTDRGRKSLTPAVVGAFAPGASVAEEVQGLKFRIGAMGIWNIKEKSDG
jgi:hypothetical protein